MCFEWLFKLCCLSQDVTTKHGWRTGAIIPELEREITCLNSSEYKRSLQWRLSLEDLIQQAQVSTKLIYWCLNQAIEICVFLQGTWRFWISRSYFRVVGRETHAAVLLLNCKTIFIFHLGIFFPLRKATKNVFNPQFGSIFRTFDNPTYFTRRLNRFADIYTSSIGNLLNYPVTHTFYTRRTALPHEIVGAHIVDWGFVLVMTSF